jgi:3-hydroxybutyryl-CoA dehydrogenase
MARIKNVTVVGAGTMGHGISQVAAAAGYRVLLHDVSRELIDLGLEAVRRNLDRGIQIGKVLADEKRKILERIEIATDLDAAARESDLVVEAVPEIVALKVDLFRQLDAAAPPHAILASNTSSLPVGKLARATSRPGLVVGMHFFNPVHVMPLLEVVRAEQTEQETVDAAVTCGRAMGKEPIVVRDSPGFASSRLGVLLGLEAMRMLEQGIASAKDIDRAMTLGYRHPVGPLRLTDIVGLDVRLAVAEHLHRELGSEAFRPPDILRKMVTEGKLGKKVGEGFYTW